MWTLRAGNGEVILRSQAYKSKASAKKGVASTMKHSALPECFERKVARNKKPFFTLKALNGQQIGKSPFYETDRSRNNGITSAATHGPKSNVVDLS